MDYPVIKTPALLRVSCDGYEDASKGGDLSKFSHGSPRLKNNAERKLRCFGVLALHPCGVDGVAQHSGPFSHAGFGKAIECVRSASGDRSLLLEAVDVS